jgi:hypothetical protein
MVPLVLVAWLAKDAAPSPPSVLRDAALATAATAAVAFGKPDIRRAILRDGRLDNVVDNFAHPIARVREGTRRDVDRFWINYVAHPLSFAAEGVYLRQRGYSRRDAFVFTQVHSVAWEFMVEGCAFPPSGKDLVNDALGAAAGIWIFDPLLRRLGLSHPPAQLAITPAGGRVAIALSF